jgi:hypothetical protein
MSNKLFQIFKTGTHTSMGGTSLVFGEHDLQYIAAGYSKTRLRAPLVLGHPADNLPEYGEVDALFVHGDGLYAQANVSDDLYGLVKNKLYNNVSASFISPHAPNNPTLGVYYLRHVGFLGAHPPAVKGMAALAFSESSYGLEFSEGYDIETDNTEQRISIPAGYQFNPVSKNIFNLAKDYQRVCPSMSFVEAAQRAETIIINQS